MLLSNVTLLPSPSQRPLAKSGTIEHMSTFRGPIPENAQMVFKGKIFEVWQWEQTMFDGSTQTFERLKRANTAEIIAVVGDKILIQEEMQPDSARSFLTVPGGQCDSGETPLQSAQRELKEETGYESNDWQLWNERSPLGKIEWTIYTYVARNCVRTSEPHLDSGERITPRLVDFEEFLMLSDDPLFRSTDVSDRLLRMRLDPIKKEEFRHQLFG